MRNWGGFGIATAALVLSLSCGAAQSVELVTNGGFETGNFSGWTTSIDPGFDGVDTLAPHTGSFGAFFGNPGISTISQTISTTTGATYHIAFWLQVEGDVLGNTTPNSFSASFGGTSLTSFTNIAGQSYTPYTFDVAATGISSVLSFSFSDAPAFIDFDDVSVTQTSVTAVPLPASLPLLASGLGMLGWVHARRRKHKQAA